jgi:hypothetical protein
MIAISLPLHHEILMRHLFLEVNARDTFNSWNFAFFEVNARIKY